MELINQFSSLLSFHPYFFQYFQTLSNIFRKFVQENNPLLFLLKIHIFKGCIYLQYDI
jgi:hypothetical protein